MSGLTPHVQASFSEGVRCYTFFFSELFQDTLVFKIECMPWIFSDSKIQTAIGQLFFWDRDTSEAIVFERVLGGSKTIQNRQF